MLKTHVVLAWYIDLLIFWTATALIRFIFFPEMSWNLIGELAVFVVLRLAISYSSVSPGDWMLSEAAYERTSIAGGAKLRQWPNLLCGLLLILEGTKAAVRWTEMDRPIPIMGYIPEGTSQAVIGVVMGLVLISVGAAIFRMTVFSRLYGLALMGFTAISVLLSWQHWDAVIERMVTSRKIAQGLPIRDGELAFVQAVVPEGILVLTVVFSGLLLLCRTRSGPPHTGLHDATARHALTARITGRN